jgi:peptide/nickel transport system substrate-binding protein/microcin C transport system substrate-binding protein
MPAPSPRPADRGSAIASALRRAVLGLVQRGALVGVAALGLLGTAEAAMAPLAPRAAASAPALPAAAPWVHAYAAYGEPRYPAGFDHFGYVNPQALKGGTLYLRNPDRRSSFDKFNPYTTTGNSPAGVVLFMLEPLAVLSGDEPQTMYGLLAEAIQVAPDKSTIAFRLNPKARFSNGDPVTAADVKHSFDSMAGKYAAPVYQTAFAGVERAVVIDDRTVRFDLKDRSNDTLFTLGTTLRIFSRKWGLGPDGKPKRFDEIVTEYPIGSGPYSIAVAASGRRIEFQKNPDYWARDLGVRRGFFNFDHIVYRYYQDGAVAREAFKAGEFDIYKEYGARSWMRQHKGPKWDDGRIKKDPFETSVGQGLQSFQLNLRRAKFQDIRVREALGYTYDFDTLNRYGLYKRCNSLFNNSDFTAEGMPSPGELKLLEPFRVSLPPAVFGPAFVAPRTHANPKELRANLLRARALLQQAGWQLAADGKLRNAQGDAFEIEYLTPSEGTRMPDWELNLSKLGIALKIRSVDFALYRRRLETFDFDMIAIVEGDFTLPAPADLSTAYLSKTADEKGSNNFRGVKSAAVDAVLAAMAAARTMDELRNAARALDRIVMWSFWQVPDLYTADERASYWNRFGLPATRPKYFTLESSLTEMPAWAVTAWWQLAPRRR